MLKNYLQNHPNLRYYANRIAGLRRVLPNFPSYGAELHARILRVPDPVRQSTHAMAVKRVLKENIPGAFAEAGVWRGDSTMIINSLAPDREFYLFDTFEGFPEALGGKNDERFRDTGIEIVKRRLADPTHVHFRKGFFPETAAGLENERFAFVLLDLDKYEPMVEGLKFFYPRLVPGAYLFIHDYNSPESDWACSRALNDFLNDKPEKVIEIADQWGSAVIRKV